MLSFSVLIPVYNGERFIARALDSVLAQTWRHFELLVCDDASTDGTAAILRRYAERDPRIRLLFHGQNKQGFTTRNDLARAARFPYCTYLDADDALAPDFLERAAAILSRREYDILEFPITVMNRNPLRRLIFRGNPKTELEGDAVFDFLFRKKAPACPFAKTIRTDVLVRSLLPDEPLIISDDIALAVPLYYHAKSYRYTGGKPAYRYHLGAGGWGKRIYTLQQFEEINRNLAATRRKVLAFFREKQLPRDVDARFYRTFNTAHVLELISDGRIENDDRTAACRIFLKYRTPEELTELFSQAGILLPDTPVSTGMKIGFKFASEICKRWLKRLSRIR